MSRSCIHLEEGYAKQILFCKFYITKQQYIECYVYTSIPLVQKTQYITCYKDIFKIILITP